MSFGTRSECETANRSTTTQIYKGTNQIQRIVMALQLLKAKVKPLTFGFSNLPTSNGPPHRVVMDAPMGCCQLLSGRGKVAPHYPQGATLAGLTNRAPAEAE